MDKSSFDSLSCSRPFRDGMRLEEALPLREKHENLLEEPGHSVVDRRLVAPYVDEISPPKRPKLSQEVCPTVVVSAPPRTPSPRPYNGFETESTPGNISQLGFDVALSPRASSKKGRNSGNSLYTQAFETAISTVLEHESFLFSQEELAVFESYRSMPYEARFLYVRLFLRKKAAWFRLDKIGYEGDLSDVLRASQTLWLNSTGFAEDESSILELEEFVALLSLEELKGLGREFNCKGSTKDRLAESLIKLSKEQLGLQRSGSLGLDFNSEGKLERKNTLIMSKVRRILGKLIRLKPEPVSLINRLHIVFYRSSEYNEKSLTTLILARISRRNFPKYQVDRRSNIFTSRDGLFEYERALKLKFEVDEIMDLNTNQTKQGLDRVIEIFESLFEPWQALVMQEQDQDLQEEQIHSSQEDKQSAIRSKYYARRFTAGWVWTRLIFKAAAVFAKRHEYIQEHQIWSTLLAQKIYRLGRRGEWYDRKALIEQHYAPTLGGPNITEAHKRKSKRIALETCIAGLQDPDTHQIYHNALQRRIMRLETDLKFTKREKHDFSHILLRKPAKRLMRGIRIDDKLTGKHSIWVGRETDSQVSVEQLCLETYEEEGWRGFHSENSIVTTLFAALFWDIIFMPIAGVFQTEFQTAPLDLATDAFYPSRASEINHRLVAIENGGSEELLRTVDATHREQETWCVGMNWAYELEDLLQITECLGGSALSQLCKLFAEEYGHRVGGIGDLCLWRPETHECMFVEVKGPGDRLSETQIAWLDQMSLAGIRVELCHVIESDPRSKDTVKQEFPYSERRPKLEKRESTTSSITTVSSKIRSRVDHSTASPIIKHEDDPE